MGRILVIVVVLVVAGLAGCIGSEDANVQTQATPREDTASLAEPPTWEVGDWWEIEMTSTRWDEPRTVTRVVADVEDDAYIVGVAEDEWDPVLMFNHIPGLDEVTKGNLSFDMHDRDFRPVDFPLTPGKGWETTYDDLPVNATVESVSNGRAQIHYCCETDVTATYDSSTRSLERLSETSGGDAYQVIDHGSGYEGTVVVPRGQDLLFLSASIAGIANFELEPAPPVRSIEVPDGYDRMTLGQWAGPINLVDQPASSVYMERATGPDGTTYETTNGPTETEITENVYEIHDPAGTWQFEHVAPGLGVALSEGIAYDWVEVELGSGSSDSGEES